MVDKIPTSGAEETPVTAAATKTLSKSAELRKINKPIMERKRRERINKSLCELKSLLLEATKNKDVRHSKLEKADILEMAVTHLKDLQLRKQQLQQQVKSLSADEVELSSKFRAGFSECTDEVARFLSTTTNTTNGTVNITNNVKGRLSTHLLRHMKVKKEEASDSQSKVAVDDETDSKQILQVIPTRLPDGQIAFMLPTTTTISLRTAAAEGMEISKEEDSTCLSPLTTTCPELRVSVARERNSSSGGESSSSSSGVPVSPASSMSSADPSLPGTPPPPPTAAADTVPEASSPNDPMWRPW